jgi:hypothetical protein
MIQNAQVASTRTVSPMSSGRNQGFSNQKRISPATIPRVATSCRLPDIEVSLHC